MSTDRPALLALVGKWRARVSDYDAKAGNGQTPENEGWIGGMAEGTDACADELEAALSPLGVAGLRQGNWHHPDGGRIVGWVIEPGDVERMGADAFCLPREVADALENLRAARTTPPPAAEEDAAFLRDVAATLRGNMCHHMAHKVSTLADRITAAPAAPDCNCPGIGRLRAEAHAPNCPTRAAHRQPGAE